MDYETTIVAVSSPQGNSSRALIRVTGSNAFKHINSVGLEVEARTLKLGRLRIGTLELPVLVGGFAETASYTGQETVEIQLPNNQHLIEKVIHLLILETNGRLAIAGEFTARAFFNGKLTLTQAEGVCATISANNNAELQGAALLRNGSFAKVIEPISDELTRSLSLVEAGIDFTDEEDVVAIQDEDLLNSIRACINNIQGVLDHKISMEMLRELPLVVIAGLPNAGKSTLFNALLGKRRVVISSKAGTTRDSIAEPAMFSGKEAMLVDIAGFDTPIDAIEASAQQHAAKSVKDADLILYCVSPLQQIPESSEACEKTIIVHTMSDLPNAHQNAICAGLDLPLICLKDLIASKLSSNPKPHQDALALMPRHEQNLFAALESLQRATEDLSTRELVADSCRSALNEIGSITGQVTPDEVLGKVFSSFCIGK